MIAATLSTHSKGPAHVAAALAVDNHGADIRTRVEDAQIISDITARSLGSLTATLDDLVRCQQAVEEVL